MEIEKHLREEIDAQLGYLGDIEANTDEYKMRVDSVTKLLDRAIEMEKLAREHEDRVAAQEAERELKEKQAEAELEFKREQMRSDNDFREKQLKEDHNSHWTQFGLTLLGHAFAAGMTFAVLRYDEKGVIPCSPVSKGWINKIFTKK